MRHAAVSAPGVRLGPAQDFSFAMLAARAKKNASQPYKAPQQRAAHVIKGIDFDAVQKIKFRPDHLLSPDAPYPAAFFHLSRYSADPVILHAVENGPSGSKAREILYGPDYFDYGASGLDPKARALLKEAGYADGFSTGLDCVAITWRAAACQAFAGMLAQVGVKVTFTPSPAAQFFPKITQAQTPFFEFGWTPTTDAWTMLNPTIRTFDPAGGGTFNGGRYSNPKLDAAIDAIRVAPSLDARRALVRDALAILAADLPLLPLYRRTLAWVMRPDVEVAMWPNDILELRFVRMKPQ